MVDSRAEHTKHNSRHCEVVFANANKDVAILPYDGQITHFKTILLLFIFITVPAIVPPEMNLTKETKLVIVKTLHTIIWVMFVAVIFYVLWSGITGNISTYSWLAVAAVCIEGLVLILFKGSCPLTPIARRYSDSDKDNFDIYLPNWLARYNKHIFTTIFLIGVILMIWWYI